LITLFPPPAVQVELDDDDDDISMLELVRASDEALCEPKQELLWGSSPS